MKPLLLLCLLALAACAHETAKYEAPTPTGPCRDDENFIEGRCRPRIPGDGAPPGGIPPWTRS